MLTELQTTATKSTMMRNNNKQFHKRVVLKSPLQNPSAYFEETQKQFQLKSSFKHYPKQFLRCKQYLYNISVGDISACSFTWADYLHNLSTLQPIISCNWISHLNTRQLKSIHPKLSQ